MPRWIGPLLTLLFVLLWFDASAFAVTVFGPRSYTRTTGAPNVTNESFAVCLPERSFRLTVENGPNGLIRVASASLMLNGAEVVSPNQFSQNVAVVERPVTLHAHNTLVITVAGTPHGTLSVSISSDTGCDIALSTPAPGAVVPEGLLLVQGITRASADVGVTVNGVVALSHGSEFAALVPVAPSTTELVAVLTRPDGSTAEARQAVMVTPAPGPEIVFRARPRGGEAPLLVSFSLISPVSASQVILDLTGQGAIGFEGPELEGRTFAYSVPGIYIPTVRLTDHQGNQYSAFTIVQVVDAGALDRLIQTKWHGMKDALRQGNVAGALNFIASTVRDGYQDFIDALVIPLAQIDTVLTDISLVAAEEDRAEYEMIRTENGERFSHYVLYVKDTDGTWRVKFF
jgi:hypothetical protein